MKNKDKVLANKTKIFMILKQRNNLIKSLILNKEYFQEKEDLVKLENVKVNQKNFI